jgi:alpha-beta hydrolase superfamily lysophospholipase
VRRSEAHFDAPDSTRLVRRSWVPASGDAPRCAVIVHGFGEHSARYDTMADWLVQRGFVVHSYDHRGHGLSDGHPNYVKRFDEYVDDAMHFLGVVREEYPRAGHVLIAHSMGGLIGALMLTTRSPDVMCAVLSGAALALPEGLSRGKRIAAQLLSLLAPKLATDPGLHPSALSRDPEVGRRYEADPLVNTKMTTRLAAQMLAAQQDAMLHGSHVAVPVLGLHGGDDPICPAEGTERFLSQVSTPYSACTVYPRLRHEIFNEPEREQVWQDLLAFVERVEQNREPHSS